MKPKKFIKQKDNSVRKIVGKNGYIFKDGDNMTIRKNGIYFAGVFLDGKLVASQTSRQIIDIDETVEII